MVKLTRTAGIGSAVALLAATLALVGGATLGASAAGAATSFSFIGGGYGHGVGMSQWGAKGRADQGQAAGDILGAYYPGTSIVATAPGRIPRTCVSLRFATTQMSCRGTTLIVGCPGCTSCPTSIDFRLITPVAGAVITV